MSISPSTDLTAVARYHSIHCKYATNPIPLPYGGFTKISVYLQYRILFGLILDLALRPINGETRRIVPTPSSIFAYFSVDFYRNSHAPSSATSHHEIFLGFLRTLETARSALNLYISFRTVLLGPKIPKDVCVNRWAEEDLPPVTSWVHCPMGYHVQVPVVGYRRL